MVGTEQGAILAGNRKAKNPGDRITGSYTGGQDQAGGDVNMKRGIHAHHLPAL